MIVLEKFSKRIEKYVNMDYGFNYYPFWKWKISIEQNDGHILDQNNVSETHEKLMPIMRYWQTYRPFKTSVISERLRHNLEEIGDAYDRIRQYDLLHFNKAPKADLKIIWNKLGCVKETDGKENRFSRYYSIAVCKPLMFLWGQTLAFDKLVKKNLPDPGYAGFSNNKWTFDLWYNVMKDYQRRILDLPDFVELSKIICRKNFGTEKFVPYGQFVDLNYWVAAKDKQAKSRK